MTAKPAPITYDDLCVLAGERHARVLWAHYVEGLTYKAIGRELGVVRQRAAAMASSGAWKLRQFWRALPDDQKEEFRAKLSDVSPALEVWTFRMLGARAQRSYRITRSSDRYLAM